MPIGLNIGRLVRVSVNISPVAAARKGFGTLLVAGDSNVIDGSQRLRSYTTIESVAADFGTSAPEYKAAVLYFGQSPKPSDLMIGRWLRTATAGFLKGGTLSAADQQLSNWTGITTGSFAITVDGVAKTVTGLNFASVTNMNMVASTINGVLTGGTVAWDGYKFIVTSSTTGIASTVTYATATGTGVDVSTQLKLTAATASSPPVAGYAAETPVAAATALANQSGGWYGLTFAAATMPTDIEITAVAAFIEAAASRRILGVTATSPLVLDPTNTTDIASVMKSLQYKHTAVQYSANPYAIASMMGRAFSVNFNANRSVITLMYKQEPGVVPEFLSETDAQTLKNKRANVFVNYLNDTAILQYGVMSGEAYFDEIHGLDWFADSVQAALYNLLYTSATKIPQTDAGQNEMVNAVAQVCESAIENGLAAPGVWNAEGFGQIKRGDYLPRGYYIYTQSMALQDQSMREQRIAPPITVALKLAGAFHEIDAIINVNR